MCRFLDTRRGQNNADGFGIGFYTDPKLGSAPCLFTSTIPAWNCTNLQRIASKTASRLIFGHVRATTEGSLSEDNCHPFTHGSLMWMHNGGLGGWKYIKRRLGERLADKWYLGVKGGTDSEWAFALFLDTLERLGHDPSACPETGFGPTILREAMKRTIAQINEMTDAIPESILQNEDVDTRSLLNFAVTDGHSVICTRYISSSKDEAASLYYSSGTQWTTRTQSASDKQYQMEREDRGADIVLVASEPLTFERENWVNVPTNSILTIHRQTVMVHPIIDKYYERDPHHVRSSAFVQAKGLTSNEKNRSDVASPAGVDRQQQELEGYRKMMTGTLNFGPPRSLSPDMCRQTRKVAPVCESMPVPQAQAQPPPAQTTPPNEQGNKPAPAQGNIKVKRRSVQLLDGNQGQSSTDYDQISDTEEPARRVALWLLPNELALNDDNRFNCNQGTYLTLPQLPKDVWRQVAKARVTLNSDMTCDVAIIRYEQCLHRLLFKVGCTQGCKELCPPSRQRVLVVTSYLWLCEDCHKREFTTELVQRCHKWTNLQHGVPLDYPPEQQNMLSIVLQNRECLDNVFRDSARAMKLEEIQWVAEWTYEYGLMLYDVTVAGKWVRSKAMRRIDQLRSLRLWDLVVIKDGLRCSKELFEDQPEETYWTISEQFAEQHYDRASEGRLPKPSRPQPPLFFEIENTNTPETKESAESPDMMDWIQDGEEDDDEEPVTEQPHTSQLLPDEQLHGTGYDKRLPTSR
ncbi:glutamine amidotransferase [Fusarium agapanthi]|uniref:Glutamine amidotransferase n=1 Tax=Fusarium agapanthi TaxID=1803897 RepID=A0A9P5B4V8_9HYPO|nr:glutamine amidotransferase [Fusarium agapanthi]